MKEAFKRNRIFFYASMISLLLYLGAFVINPQTINAGASATSVNSTVQKFIAQNYPGSVWQYYQLVNVIKEYKALATSFLT